MSSVSVENSRIRVTVSKEIWERYRERSESASQWKASTPSGLDPVKDHNEIVEVIMRGYVLSDAMMKLGNASEAILMTEEPVDMRQVLSIARNTLVLEYLEANSAYSTYETMRRMMEGRRMSQGMSYDADRANAYASSILEPLSHEEMTRIAQGLCSFREPETDSVKFNREKKLFDIRTQAKGTEKAKAVIAEAAQFVTSQIRDEIALRRRWSNMDGWKIEVLGDLPDCIGVCSTERAPRPTEFNDEIGF